MTKLAETKETKRDIPIWLKLVGYVAFVILVTVSGYLTLKAELPHIESYFNPFYVRKDVSSAPTEKITPESLLAAVNTERAKAGVTPLVLDPRLNQSAQTKADDMKARNYFGHVDPNGKNGATYIFDFAPGTCSYASENITDSGDPKYNTLDAGIKAWVDSPTHYRAMTNPDYDLTGFGITSTGLVQHFCQL